MPITDWLDMMPFTVTVAAAATYDAYGKPATYATAASYRARVVAKTKVVRSRVSGQDVLTDTQIWINGVLAALDEDARITLPDATTLVPVSWDTFPDEDGDHHTKIYGNRAV